MTREVTVAATQMRCGADRARNVARAEALVREAAGRGANIVLLQELFETVYFCQEQRQELFELAAPAAGHPTLERMSALAKELGVVLPVSFFERANMAHYNAVMVIDADGRQLGRYRKSHIPDGPGYQE
jgi:N-carbamoylputrescine amidase